MMAKKKRSYKRKGMSSKKPRSPLIAILWLLTGGSATAFFWSIGSVLVNDFAVSPKIWITMAISAVITSGLIIFRLNTTNESLAFSRGK